MDDNEERPKEGVSSEELVITEAHLALEKDFGGLMACADILAVMEGEYGTDFVKRVAWDMADPEDCKKLFAAAIVLGEDTVIKKIIERTGAVFEKRSVNTRLDTEEAVLEVGEGDGRKVVIRHDVHLPDKTEFYSMERR